MYYSATAGLKSSMSLSSTHDRWFVYQNILTLLAQSGRLYLIIPNCQTSVLICTLAVPLPLTAHLYHRYVQRYTCILMCQVLVNNT